MEAAITTVGGALLSASFDVLFDELASHDLLGYAREGDVADELKKWEIMLKKINLVLDDAEEKQMANPLVKLWVSELRDLAYDVEDILDEFATEVHRRKLEDETIASTSKFRKLIPTCCTGLNFGTLRFNAEMVSKIKSITARFDEIIKQKNALPLAEGGRRKIGERPPTTSLVNEAQIFGRQNDKEAIVEMLKAGATDAKLSVIPIVGMAGVGKTTLAQLIYNDATLEFDLRSWVSVGEDFDVLRMSKTILESNDDKDLNMVQLKLKEKLSMKKFLIVLDDVWTENYEAWTHLCAPFTVGAQGSSLIITTRSQNVSAIMGSVPAYHLQELGHHDCMSVFVQHALGAENFADHMDLEELGTRIVKRCQGLPLAAKALGGLLRGKPYPSVWMEVLRSEIWDLSDDKSNILPALRVSYFHLPSHLKQCFAYCAIFPKDYEFDANELVLLWMAEGFLYQPKKVKQMEDLGHQYFRDLLLRSFFQRSTSGESKYVMHDLMNDLARYVSTGTCFQLGDKLEDEQLYPMVRHLSFIRGEFATCQEFEGFLKMKSLRTVLPLPILAHDGYYCHRISTKVLYELVPKLKFLRTLSLAGCFDVMTNVDELPSSIGGLKHLRYLDLSHTSIRRLPESVAALLNLQTLKLCGCRRLTVLPSDIGNLANLHCLDIRGTSSLRRMPLHIGNLKNLHTLTKFIVGKDNGLKLTELKKLPHLQGVLYIEGLQNVMDISDAHFSNLKGKQGLENLNLEWADDFNGCRNPSDEVQILNALMPHENLSSLSIVNFGGTEFPSWLGDPTFKKMVKLDLRNCRNIMLLPPLGQLPSLEKLSIAHMDGVKEVGVELYGDGLCFASLKSLSIEFMREWEKWSFCDNLNLEVSVRFPKLCDLEVKCCQNLVGKLPSHLPSLQKLYLLGCQEALLRGVSDLTSLTTLDIFNISGLACLDEAHLEDLVALQYLSIGGCVELKYLWKDGTNINKLASLKDLHISACLEMVSLVEGEEGHLPCNLQVLSIAGCENLKTLTNGLHRLSCLKYLTIAQCNKLESFTASGVPRSLISLDIRDCNSLEFPNQQMSELEVLTIRGCKHLWSSQNVEFPDLLKTLRIDGTVLSVSVHKIDYSKWLLLSY